MTRVQALDFLDELRAFGAVLKFKNRKLAIVKGRELVGVRRYERFYHHRAILASVLRREMAAVKVAFSTKALAP